MSTPERSPERDAAIEAMLPHVATGGWTLSTLVEAAGPDADLLFPGGPPDIVEAYCDLADRWMQADAAGMEIAELRLPDRVRTVIAARLRRNEPYKGAVRRAVGVLAMPGRAALAVQTAARTVDTVWFAAGDTSADFSWYTKRGILAGVYASTLLYWLNDSSDRSVDTLTFLDRRLASVGRIGDIRRRVSKITRPGLKTA
jgi:ubiquinone biosynthesis protein COQ9